MMTLQMQKCLKEPIFECKDQLILAENLLVQPLCTYIHMCKYFLLNPPISVISFVSYLVSSQLFNIRPGEASRYTHNYIHLLKPHHNFINEYLHNMNLSFSTTEGADCNHL